MFFRLTHSKQIIHTFNVSHCFSVAFVVLMLKEQKENERAEKVNETEAKQAVSHK
jgi:hypothetical protein